MPSPDQQLRRVARTIRTMDRRADNMIPVWRQIGSYIARNNRKQFTTRGRHYGTPWKPLSPRTLADKLRRGYGRAPLVRTGDLKRDFVGRPMGVEVYTPKKATYGSNKQLAVWQQYGTRRNGKRHIPPRVIMRITKDLRAEIHRRIQAHVMKGK